MKKVSIAIALFLVVVISYYSYVVREARSSTPHYVQAAKAKITGAASMQDLNENRLDLLLKIQDPNFFAHSGTDFLSGRVTTLTQSLVKFLYFDKFKPGLAKIRQSLIARYALDPLVSKEDQLYLFLNLTYFGEFNGEPVRGFGNAARTYFQKSLKELSDQEYFGLLAMLSGPNEYNVRVYPQKNADRVAQLRAELKL